jgi:hypothetical protein
MSRDTPNYTAIFKTPIDASCPNFRQVGHFVKYILSFDAVHSRDMAGLKIAAQLEIDNASQTRFSRLSTSSRNLRWLFIFFSNLCSYQKKFQNNRCNKWLRLLKFLCNTYPMLKTFWDNQSARTMNRNSIKTVLTSFKNAIYSDFESFWREEIHHAVNYPGTPLIIRGCFMHCGLQYLLLITTLHMTDILITQPF